MVLLNILEINSSVKQTSKYIETNQPGITDLRNVIHPKIQSQTKLEEYTQVFGDRHGFIPNLSILDLLFNLGPQSNEYLRTIILSTVY